MKKIFIWHCVFQVELHSSLQLLVSFECIKFKWRYEEEKVEEEEKQKRGGKEDQGEGRDSREKLRERKTRSKQTKKGEDRNRKSEESKLSQLIGCVFLQLSVKDFSPLKK